MDEQTNVEPPSRRSSDNITTLLASARPYIQALPSREQRIATRAAAGAPTWEIAHELGISDAAVARSLDGIVAAITGREIHPVETGGLGADTDPGVTGGYDPASFGALDIDSVLANTDPSDRAERGAVRRAAPAADGGRRRGRARDGNDGGENGPGPTRRREPDQSAADRADRSCLERAAGDDRPGDGG